jgi:hypothetical protein
LEGAPAAKGEQLTLSNRRDDGSRDLAVEGKSIDHRSRRDLLYIATATKGPFGAAHAHHSVPDNGGERGS